MSRSMTMLGRTPYFGARKLPSVFEHMNMEHEDDITRRKNHLANNPAFNISITCAIIINIVLVGVEADNVRTDTLEDRLLFVIIDLLFTLLFFIEMLIRQNQLGWDYFCDAWNMLDYVLVVVNFMDVVIAITRSPADSLKLASVFRALRLMRVSRNIKGLKVFDSLWLVLQGILDSLRTLAWVSLLVVILVYITAVTLCSVVGGDELLQDRWRYSDQYVGSVINCIFTVLQIVTLDKWLTDIGRPIWEASPFSLFLMILMISICSFGTLNIVIAVMVERMQANAREGDIVTQKALEKTEMELLMSLAGDLSDASGHEGEVTLDEFRRMIKENPLVRFKLRLLGLNLSESESIFEIMDADRSGSVSPEEFVAGLQKLKGVAKGEDLVQLICFAQKQCIKADNCVERIRQMSKQADMIQERMNNVGLGLTGELHSLEESETRNEVVKEQAASRKGFINTLDKHRQIHFPSLVPEQDSN